MAVFWDVAPYSLVKVTDVSVPIVPTIKKKNL
jgi:hypothetical protein